MKSKDEVEMAVHKQDCRDNHIHYSYIPMLVFLDEKFTLLLWFIGVGIISFDCGITIRL